jgi:hypothetical protein
LGCWFPIITGFGDGWLVTLALLACFILIVSHGITGIWSGWLINEENKMSLSRLQLIAWTLIVLSGYLTAALANLAAQQCDPLSIAIPEELWLLLGISTTSLVGSPLLKSNKKVKKPNDTQKTATFDLLEKQGASKKQLDHQGLIVVNKDPDDAKWSDLFKGEETGNAGLLDVAKIQMFL